MKTHWSTISLFFVFGWLNGQSVQEFPVSFSTTTQNETISPVFSVDEVPAHFRAFSAYTYAAENVELFFRVRKQEGWGAWTPFSVSHATEGQERKAFEAPALFQTFEAVQFSSATALSQKIMFRLYTALYTAVSVTPVPQFKTLANCSCAQPLICERTCWCPDGTCPKDATPSFTQPTHLIVHHSAGFANAPDYAQVVSYYWDLHVNTNGWDDIGYNWLIDPDGVVYEGRGSGVAGAHFSCMNAQTSGICIIGNYNSQVPSDTALGSLRQLLAWESCDKNIVLDDTSYHASSQLFLPNVSAHRDGNFSPAPNSCASGTVCPGDSLYAHFYEVAMAASALDCTEGVSLEEYRQVPLGLYPNPVYNKLNLALSAPFHPGTVNIKVRALNGRLLMHLQEPAYAETGVTVEVSGLAEGMYLLELFQEENEAKQFFVKK